MMKRFGVSLAVCLAAMIWGAAAHAEPVHVLGVGQFSCGQFISTIGKHPPGKVQNMPIRDELFVSENGLYQQWLMAFVSGFNASHKDEQIIGIDGYGLDLWMRNWCNQHPTQSVFQGADAFIDEMRGNAGQH